ncbi:hypothetical protein [Nocardia camponoti]|uniref:Uncharacterized protein n=1 Tax=Nocardia camponoti TaxID=1616106 RepID=A0A917QUN1_9NOCA|nr:hypothetical protein [Nocardia camponoti]GGK68118.1 hypothetical protein GCM10011591_45330 [Nocardia camponoti]
MLCKRVSDISLHVFVSPEILDQIVAGVREVVDDHVTDRDIFAWRFTLPIEATDPAYLDLESRWRRAHFDADPGALAAYEIAVSLVSDPDELTEGDLASLEHGLALAVHHTAPTSPFTLRADRRTELDHEYR